VVDRKSENQNGQTEIKYNPMKIFSSIILLLLSTVAQAQEIEMADQMRSEGKIYVVIAVVLTILIGLIIYLISIDKKLGKLEKELKN